LLGYEEATRAMAHYHPYPITASSFINLGTKGSTTRHVCDTTLEA